MHDIRTSLVAVVQCQSKLGTRNLCLHDQERQTRPFRSLASPIQVKSCLLITPKMDIDSTGNDGGLGLGLRLRLVFLKTPGLFGRFKSLSPPPRLPPGLGLDQQGRRQTRGIVVFPQPCHLALDCGKNFFVTTLSEMDLKHQGS